MEPLSSHDPRVIGEFQLRGRLGAGGMGRVYLGFSPAGWAVAVKVVHPELATDDQFRRRFAREVAAVRAVSGRYTAPVVATGLDDDPPWLATMYVPGPSLAEIVAKHGPLPEPAVWRLAAGLTEALRAVHACGLVHRDLKPANVLLAPDGPRVIDFGISRALDGTQLTATGMVVGTLGYMAPEQAEGAHAGPASDVFSLGCVLTFATTGDSPFGSGSAASVLYRVVSGRPDLAGVPDRLRDVVSACLVKDPTKRAGLSALAAMLARSAPPADAGGFWPAPVAMLIKDSAPWAGPSPAPTRPAAPESRDVPPSRTWAPPPWVPPPWVPPPRVPSPWVPDGRSPYGPTRVVRPAVTAARLMRVGAAVSLLNTVVALAAVHQLKSGMLIQNPRVSVTVGQQLTAVVGAAYIVPGVISIGLWLWMASATSRGRAWVRPVGTTLFGIDTLSLAGSAWNTGIATTRGISVVIWLIGLAAVLTLWRRPGAASDLSGGIRGRWRGRWPFCP